MTNPTTEIDPLDAFEKRPSLSFDPSRGGHGKGEKVQLLVQDFAKMIDDRDPETKEIQYWPLRAGETTPRAKQKLVLNVVDVNDDNTEKTLWAKPVRKGKALFAALIEAQKKVRQETGDKNYRLGEGDTLWISYIGDDTSVPAKMGNHPKMFAAKIVPGQRPAPQSADPFADETPSQPAPAAAPQSDPWTDSPTIKSKVGGDPFGDVDTGDAEPPF